MNNRDLTQLHSVARRRHTARVIRGWVWRSMLPIPCACSLGASGRGADPPTKDEFKTLLDLASQAAHSSERVAAPVACWLAAKAGIDPDTALAKARELDA